MSEERKHFFVGATRLTFLNWICTYPFQSVSTSATHRESYSHMTIASSTKDCRSDKRTPLVVIFVCDSLRSFPIPYSFTLGVFSVIFLDSPETSLILAGLVKFVIVIDLTTIQDRSLAFSYLTTPL